MTGAAVATVLRKRHNGEQPGKSKLSPPRGYIYSQPASSADMFDTKCKKLITVNDLKQVMKEMDNHEKGFDRLLGLVVFSCLFFIANQLKYDTAFTYSVNTGLLTVVESVTFGDDDKTYADVRNQNDLVQWFSALGMDLYNGDGLEDICRLCSLYECQTCIDLDLHIDECSDCWTLQKSVPRCFDGTCTDNSWNTESTYPYDWDTAPVSDCWDEWTILFEKGMTSSVHRMYNFSNSNAAQIPYSSTSGKIANNVKLGSSAALTWKRVQSSACMNEAIQSLYGKCKDYNSLIKEDINTTGANYFISPTGYFEFNEEAQANGIYMDFGAYNFGGWLPYCITPVMQATNSFENVESVALTVIGLNAQIQGLVSVIKVEFEFTPGGLINADIDVTSFPVVSWNSDTTPAEYFYIFMTAIVCLAVPFGTMLYMKVIFLYQNRKAGWKLKYYLILSWMQKPINFWFVVNMYMVMACSISSIGSTNYFYHLVEEGQIQFGRTLDTSVPTAVIAQVIAAGAVIEDAIIRFGLADGFFFVTILTLLILLLHTMSFHKRLAIVKEVILGAAMDLAHFVFVFFLIVIIFTMMVTTVFGPQLENFNTLSKSFKVMLRIGFGDPGDYFDEFMNFPRQFIGSSMVFSIQIIVSLVLLNIVISICVDAYLTYQKQYDVEHYWTVIESLKCYLCRKFLRMQKAFCSEATSTRSATRKLQTFYCAVFSQSQHTKEGEEPLRTITLSVALKILQSSPCQTYYAKLALKNLENIQKDAAKESQNEVLPEKNTSELFQVKKKLEDAEKEIEDAKKEIQRLNALLQLHRKEPLNVIRKNTFNPVVNSFEEKETPFS